MNAADPSGCEPIHVSYYFYNDTEEFSKRVEKRRSIIANELGYDSIDNVITIPMSDEISFRLAWYNLGNTLNNESVVVDLLFVSTHGYPEVIQTGSDLSITKEVISHLPERNIGSMILHSCYTGASERSIAAEFAKKINGPVLAATDQLHMYPLPFLGYKVDGNGWVIITEKDGQIERKLLNQNWMKIKEMVEAVK